MVSAEEAPGFLKDGGGKGWDEEKPED